MQDWRHPETGLSGPLQTLYVMAGPGPPDEIDGEMTYEDGKTHYSDKFVDALAAKKTKVVLRVGTHDFTPDSTGLPAVMRYELRYTAPPTDQNDNVLVSVGAMPYFPGLLGVVIEPSILIQLDDITANASMNNTFTSGLSSDALFDPTHAE